MRGERAFGHRGGAGGGPMFGQRGGANGGPLQRLTTKLSLTDAQVAEAKTILDDLHVAIQARVQRARANFRAYLAPSGATAPEDVPQPSGAAP